MTKPRVAVIGTGGTISSVGRHSLDLVRYIENNKVYEVDELLNAFPETLEQADLVPVRLKAIPSTAIGPVDWLAINAKVNEVIDDDPSIDGIVISMAPRFGRDRLFPEPGSPGGCPHRVGGGAASSDGDGDRCGY